MQSLISVLAEEPGAQVMHLWRRLNEACGLQGIFNFPTPHFTWMTAEAMPVKQVAPIIEALTYGEPAFEIRTSGLDLFPGERPVLYLPVVKSENLMRVHQALWDQVQPYMRGASGYYAPHAWTPHITLALMDLTFDKLTCAIDAVATESIDLVSWIDSLSLVEQVGAEIGETVQQFSFQGAART